MLAKLNLVVVGAGTMGSGIAYSSALAGHDVTVVEQDAKYLEQGIRRIEQYIEKGLARGIMDKDQATAARGRIRGTLDFSEACRAADMVVEAVFEDPRVKEQVFSKIDSAAPRGAILASNTSSISITKLAKATRRPDRVLGIHFFNPVPTMKLVELIKGEKTSSETINSASQFIKTLGKTVVQSADKTGFIVNKALMPFINEGVKLLEQRVASRDDIDQAFILGANHPMGPLRLADFIGIDVVLSTLKVLEAEYGSCYHPAKTLENMVSRGELGRKTKKGFYDY